MPFHAWTVDPCQWGGRLPPENAGSITALEQTSVTRLQLLLQEWLDSSESSPFSQHPPDSLTSAVQDILLRENAQHATEHILHHSDSAFVQSLPNFTVGIHSIPTTLESDKASEWSIGPPAEWLTAPLASRPKLGQTLLSHAMSSIREGTTTTLQTPYTNDTWSCPFNVGYLNVGRRRLVGSLPEVVVLVLRYRPDILFLGDLVTSRDHIGRLKKQIERNLKDEWFMILVTNINASSGRPVGVGAIIHCSLAKCITDCTIQPPDGLQVDQKEWEKAVSGRILRIKVSRPGVPYTWQFTGVYQHVAKSVKRMARAQVRNRKSQRWEKVEKTR
jgi:hypothetical protein